MGWLELLGWLKAMRRQNAGPEPDPHHWTDHDRRWFDEQHAKQKAEERGF